MLGVHVESRRPVFFSHDDTFSGELNEKSSFSVLITVVGPKHCRYMSWRMKPNEMTQRILMHHFPVSCLVTQRPLLLNLFFSFTQAPSVITFINCLIHISLLFVSTDATKTQPTISWLIRKTSVNSPQILDQYIEVIATWIMNGAHHILAYNHCCNGGGGSNTIKTGLISLNPKTPQNCN